jgi:lipoate-protein ligase A
MERRSQEMRRQESDGVLLQHGTILYNLDVSKMFSVLNVSKEKSIRQDDKEG